MRNVVKDVWKLVGCRNGDDVSRIRAALLQLRAVRRARVTQTNIELVYDADEMGAPHVQRLLTRLGPFRLVGEGVDKGDADFSMYASRS